MLCANLNNRDYSKVLRVHSFTRESIGIESKNILYWKDQYFILDQSFTCLICIKVLLVSLKRKCGSENLNFRSDAKINTGPVSLFTDTFLLFKAYGWTYMYFPHFLLFEEKEAILI